MVNYNPETVSTDYDMCDRLYFEEISFEVNLTSFLIFIACLFCFSLNLSFKYIDNGKFSILNVIYKINIISSYPLPSDLVKNPNSDNSEAPHIGGVEVKSHQKMFR